MRRTIGPDWQSVLAVRQHEEPLIEALEWFGDQDKSNLKAAIGNPLFAEFGRSTTHGMDAVHAYFGSDRPSHCFGLEQHNWISLVETQVTRGLCHFMTVPARNFRHARIAAFVTAAAHSASSNASAVHTVIPPGSGLDPLRIRSACVEAESSAGTKRIDLLIRVETDTGSIGVVIEAKLEHKLTPGQLSAYRAFVRLKHGLSEQNCIFLVVGLRRTQAAQAELVRQKGIWRFVSWRRLMLRMEKALAADDLDHDFRRFRRTVWQRTEGL